LWEERGDNYSGQAKAGILFPRLFIIGTKKEKRGGKSSEGCKRGRGGTIGKRGKKKRLIRPQPQGGRSELNLWNFGECAARVGKGDPHRKPKKKNEQDIARPHFLGQKRRPAGEAGQR